jgi:hypothetical protein
MTHIVRTAYRYKRPPRRKQPVALEVPAVVKAADPAKAHSAAEATQRPDSPPRKPAVLTIRRQAARIIPAGRLAETPEEHQHRGDAADAMWRELVRRVREDS